MDPISLVIALVPLMVPVWLVILKGSKGIFNKITDGIAARASRPKEPKKTKEPKKKKIKKK